MTVKEYEDLKEVVINNPKYGVWHWEVLKVLWQIAKAVKIDE